MTRLEQGYPPKVKCTPSGLQVGPVLTIIYKGESRSLAGFKQHVIMEIYIHVPICWITRVGTILLHLTTNFNGPKTLRRGSISFVAGIHD